MALFLILLVIILLNHFEGYLTFEGLYPLFEWPIAIISPFVSEAAMKDSSLITYVEDEWFILSPAGAGLMYGTFYIFIFWLIRKRS
jgi:hypothetical protein